MFYLFRGGMLTRVLPLPSAMQSVELFNGRIAMLGFAAAVIGQFQMGGYDGPGPVAQVSLNTPPHPASRLHATRGNEAARACACLGETGLYPM
jgi:hypothetical protein